MSAEKNVVQDKRPEYVEMSLEAGEENEESKDCCSQSTFFSVLEFAVPIITLGQLAVLQYRNVIMPECPSKLIVAVTPVLACETLLITLMILCVTVLSFHQEQICGKLNSFKEYTNVLPAFFFTLCGNIFILSTGGVVVVFEHLNVLLKLKETYGCYDSGFLAATLASVMLIEYLVSFSCLILLSKKLYQEKRNTVIYGHAKCYFVLLIVYCFGFITSQTGAALLIERESKFGLYFLTPSTQIHFLFEHICIYICGIAVQTGSWDMKILSFIAVFESVAMKWIDFHIDTFFFDINCSLNVEECTLIQTVWFGTLCRNIAFSMLGVLKLKALCSYICGTQSDPELKNLYFPRAAGVDSSLLEPLA